MGVEEIEVHESPAEITNPLFLLVGLRETIFGMGEVTSGVKSRNDEFFRMVYGRKG